MIGVWTLWIRVRFGLDCASGSADEVKHLKCLFSDELNDKGGGGGGAELSSWAKTDEMPIGYQI